jgi:Antitoxin VbhA
MKTVDQSKKTLTPAALIERRRAVDSALGSLRIEGMELEPEVRDILERFACGEMSLAEMRMLNGAGLNVPFCDCCLKAHRRATQAASAFAGYASRRIGFRNSPLDSKEFQSLI